MANLFSPFMIEGKNPQEKPILLIFGVHGNEAQSIAVGIHLFRYRNDLERKHERSILVLPVANPRASMSNKRSYSDDFNRNFEEIYMDYRSWITDAVQGGVHCVIDVHSSPRCSNLCIVGYDKKHTNNLVDVIKKSKFDYLVYKNEEDSNLRWFSELNETPCMTVELSGIGYHNKQQISKDAIDILDLIKHADTWDFNTPSEEDGTYPWAVEVTAETSGYIYINPSKDISKFDSKIGFITDIDGHDCDINSPCDGKVLSVAYEFFVNKGDVIAMMQPIEMEEIPF